MKYQAIVTRYIGPSNHRPSRIKATCAAGSMTVSYDGSAGINGNHIEAAKALADKFGWRGVWFGGGMPQENGSNVFVCVDLADIPEPFKGSAFITRGSE